MDYGDEQFVNYNLLKTMRSDKSMADSSDNWRRCIGKGAG